MLKAREGFRPLDSSISNVNHLNFCASLSKSGTSSKFSSNFKDFTPLISRSSISWVDCIVKDLKRDVNSVTSIFGFSDGLINSLVEQVSLKSRSLKSAYQDLGDEMGMILPIIHAKGFDVSIEPLLIVLRKNVILTVHASEISHFVQLREYAPNILKRIQKPGLKINDLLTFMLIRIIDENNSLNFEQVSEIEEASDIVSRELSDVSASRKPLGSKIYHMKHALVKYLSGLWATVDVLSSLRYGDADAISDNEHVLEGVGLQINEVHAQIGLAENLANVLASGLEVLQSIYNNQLQLINNRLSFMVGLLTIVGTALLVPNTIATVLSQTNIFQFTPADSGWYLALILTSTLVSTIFAWIWVNKVGLLPKSPDQE